LVTTSHAPAKRPPLSRRIKVGLVLTGVSLVLLIFPGYMALPLTALTPLMPHTGGCANFGAGIVAVAFFGLAFLLSAALIVLGILAIIGSALRSRIGLVGAVLINAVILSLLLMTPLDVAAQHGFDIFLTVSALIPAAALALLLSPAVFGSWWHGGRPFVATAAAAGLLLLPGAAGSVVLGFEMAGMSFSQPTPSQTGTRAC
jgi:hypothetical protein